MPFTVSHIAAVLPAGRFPLLRDPLILSAFVIGSMSPDVPYFVPLGSWTDFYGWSSGSHTLGGIFAIDLPVTLALVAVFWLVLAAPLRALAPRALRARLPQHVLKPHLATPLRTAALLVLAAVIGAATHVVWDAFTHEGRFGVMAVPWLQLPHLLGPLPGYRVLQYFSTIFGLAIVCWSLVHWYRTTPASAEVPAGLGWRWQAAIAGGVVMAGVLSWWSTLDLIIGATDFYDVREALTYGVTRSMAFMALVVLVGAIAAHPALLRAEANSKA